MTMGKLVSFVHAWWVTPTPWAEVQVLAIVWTITALVVGGLAHVG
jgi:hypothetical protein